MVEIIFGRYILKQSLDSPSKIQDDWWKKQNFFVILT